MQALNMSDQTAWHIQRSQGQKKVAKIKIK
jgi:hypothetical protein